MRVNTLYFMVLISGTCLGYKLRRDISKVKHYCKEICMQCGGEAALSRDICVCNTEEAEGKEVQRCLERARNKFEFLGIKLETDNRPVNKSSVYRPHHPTHPENDEPDLRIEPDQGKRDLFKRSSLVPGIHNGLNSGKNSVHDRDSSGLDDKHRSKRSFNDYGSRLDITRFADVFENKYPIGPAGNFKILLGTSKQPGLNRGLYYDMMASQQRRDDDEDSTDDEGDSSESSEYSEDQRALGDELNLRRLGRKETSTYKLTPPPNLSDTDYFTAKEFSSIWDSVLLEILNRNYYIPSNFAENVLLV